MITKVEVKQGNRTIPAVAQMTKQGMLFILNRTNGKPIFGVEERPVPTGPEGDGAWPTQPFPVKPAPLARDSMTLNEVSKLSPEAEAYCTAAMGGHALVPYSLTAPSFPSGVGGSNWGGVAVDPNLGLIFANTSELGRAPGGGRGGRRGPELGPAAEPVRGGAGPDGRGGEPDVADQDAASRFASERPNSNRFVGPNYYPCNQPPWKLLTAVDANTGDIVWNVPLGSYKELEEKGIQSTGTPNLGGAIATAGGLVFIGATNDQRFRAFDSKTGKELWTRDVDGDAMSVPITYEVSGGRQFVAIAIGGPGLLYGVGPRDAATTQYKGMIVAFALPH